MPSITFLFWNIHRKDLSASIVRLCRQHSVDILILAENTISPGTLLTALNSTDEAQHHYLPDARCKKIHIFARYSQRIIQSLDATTRAAFRTVNIPAQPEFLLCAVHLPDKRNFSGTSQTAEASRLSEHIRRIEAQQGHTRTVLVGDSNINPFEAGVVSASGLHAVMTREIAAKQDRIVQASAYSFFYDPMWGHFGDRHSGPPGTYYYKHAEHDVYFWNMFDQVLLRPALLPMFRSDSLQILQTDGQVSLVTEAGRPDAAVASDHLPILFQLNFDSDLDSGETP